MINWKDYKPILVVPAVPYNNGIRFLHQDKQFDIDGDIVPILWNVLSFCDGHRTLNEIVKISKIDPKIIKEILLELNDMELISDSREQYRHFHAISNYPPKYFRLLDQNEVNLHKKSKRKDVKLGQILNYKHDITSSLYKLQSNRKSCRNFSTEKQLSLSQLGNVCDYAYSLTRHATPSGGALFPLKIYCIVTKKQKDFDAGYYEYDAEKSVLVLYNKKIDIEQLKFCFNDELLAFNSPIQIVIAADLDRQPYKYSNRGYRLTLIEVGQVAQNISLYCEEQGLSSCELGGILDKPLTYELDIGKSNISPILAIAIGYSSSNELFKYANLLPDIAQKYVGEDKPVKSYGINDLSIEDASFYGAWSKYGKDGKRIAGATGVSYNEAVCKAIIEGYERYRSSIVKIDYIGSSENSEYFYKPEEIAPLSQNQRLLWNLSSYNSNNKIEWTKDMTGKYYIPTDFVYYGHKKEKKLFLSDSSGIAAYSNYDEAKKRALAELIERDAVMRSWYKQKSPKHVNPKYFSEHIKKRINYWRVKNRKIHILNLESKYLPVFLVIIISKDYPCFVSGAAASIGNINDAMLKALQEAEYNLLLAMENPNYIVPSIKNIKTPHDHGRYYHFYENSQKISWLWSNGEYADITETYNFNKLIDDLNAVFVDLSESSDSQIKVVRAISKKLVPISFGYQADYYLHSELKNIINPISRTLPHYFA
ncbi:MAG: YcaO-like family protein [Bacilli bacterium]|nr:YcaO-like family protein [Bacilli bacterium]